MDTEVYTTTAELIWSWRVYRECFSPHLIIYPLTARVVGAPQMISQPVFSIFPWSPLPLGPAELQACPFPDFVFPLPLSALSSYPFHPISMACIPLWSSDVRAHDSQAYRKMDVTRECISSILELREILLLFQSGFNFVNAAVVCAILESISGLEPSQAYFNFLL